MQREDFFEFKLYSSSHYALNSSLFFRHKSFKKIQSIQSIWCFTRSRSSARLALLKRSRVPTR